MAKGGILPYTAKDVTKLRILRWKDYPGLLITVSVLKSGSSSLLILFLFF